MKDNFSAQSAQYAQFRPQYPPEMFEFLFAKTARFEAAWDCGTGNGQVAQVLAMHFKNVLATDISARQLEKATPRPNIRYAIEPAEKCSAPDGTFDLIAVAQAVHWFDFERFYAEVRRALRPDGGLLALLGYGLLHFGEATLDGPFNHFYAQTLGPFWDAERRHVDAHYRSLPFPFRELPVPDFSMAFSWSRAQFLGYLGTWSAVQHFVRANGHNPLDTFAPEIEAAWPAHDPKTVRFPVFMRLGSMA